MAQTEPPGDQTEPSSPHATVLRGPRLRTPARPTVRCLQDDLDLPDLPDVRLHTIDHPVVRKAAADWPDGDVDTVNRHRIRTITSHVVFRVKTSRWRGAVWIDRDGQPWLLAGGIREDGRRDDFYATFGPAFEANPSLFLPTPTDLEHLDREAVDTELRAWEASLQESARTVVRQAEQDGTASIVIRGPDAAPLVGVEVTYTTTAVREAEDIDDRDGEPSEEIAELYVEVSPIDWSQQKLMEWAEQVILAAIHPVAIDWDSSPIKSGWGHSVLLPLDEAERMLEALDDVRTPGITTPPASSHYMHRGRLLEGVVEGTAVPTLCGVWFVPSRSPDGLPRCPACDAIYRSMTPE